MGDGIVGELLLLGAAVGITKTVLAIAIAVGVPGDLGQLDRYITSAPSDKCCALPPCPAAHTPAAAEGAPSYASRALIKFQDPEDK